MLKNHVQEHKIKRLNNNIKSIISPIPQKRAKISVVQPIFRKTQDHAVSSNNQNHNPNIPQNYTNQHQQTKGKDSNRLINFISKNIISNDNDYCNNDSLLQYKSQCMQKNCSPKNRTSGNTQEGKRILYLKHPKLNKTNVQKAVQKNHRVQKDVSQQEEQEHHSLDTFRCGFIENQKQQTNRISSGREQHKKRSITLRHAVSKPYQFSDFPLKEDCNLKNHRNQVQLQKGTLNVNLPSKRRQERKPSFILQNKERMKQQQVKFSFDNMNSTQLNSIEKYQSQKLSKNSSKVNIESQREVLCCKYHSNKKAKYLSDDLYQNHYLCSKCAVIQISKGRRVKQFNCYNVQSYHNEKKQERKQRLNDLISRIDKSEPRVFKWATSMDELQQHFNQLYSVELQKANEYYESLVQSILTIKKQTNEEIRQLIDNMKDFFIISQRTINQYLQDISFMRQDIIPNMESITDQKLLSAKDFEAILDIHYKKLDDIQKYQRAFSKSAVKIAQLQDYKIVDGYNQLNFLRAKISIKGLVLQKVIKEDKTFSFNESYLDNNRPSPVFKGM